MAAGSVEVMPTKSAALLTRLKAVSTALTTTGNGVPESWGRGLPAFPDGVPGAATSPGTRICNPLNPAITVTVLVALAVPPGPVAVRV